MLVLDKPQANTKEMPKSRYAIDLAIRFRMQWLDFESSGRAVSEAAPARPKR